MARYTEWQVFYRGKTIGFVAADSFKAASAAFLKANPHADMTVAWFVGVKKRA